MKMNKKKVLVTSLAVSFIAILSLGTLAWFNAKDEITNTFKVADSDDPDTMPDFSVDVFETDEDGNKIEGNEYLDILPGDVLHKDPTVQNTGSYDMYTRVIVTLSDANVWLTAANKYKIASNLSNADAQWILLESMTDIDKNNWKRYDKPVYDKDADTLVYVYYYDEVVAPNAETTPVFETVTIPKQLQQKDMDFGKGVDFTIHVKAEAIQADNTVPENASLGNKNEAYYAFNNEKAGNWAAGKEYGQ